MLLVFFVSFISLIAIFQGNASSPVSPSATYYFNIQSAQALVGTDSSFPSQGSAVAVSSDGNCLVTGAPKDNNSIGAIWIFARDPQTSIWSQQGGKLVGSGYVGQTVFQGSSVAISGDGNTALSGAVADDDYLGAVWVFVRDKYSDTWSQKGGKLTPNDYLFSNGGFALGVAIGNSAALSYDGSTAIIGGPNDNYGVGAAWIFERSPSGLWYQFQKKLVGTGFNLAGNHVCLQGTAVSLSGDALTAIVGASGDDDYTGAVWIFKRNTRTNEFIQDGEKIKSLEGSKYNFFGCSVSINENGTTALIGSTGFSGYLGAAFVFTRNPFSQAWNEVQILNGTDLSGQVEQGTSVGLNAHGTKALIGGGYYDDSLGAAWVFMFDSETNTWFQVGDRFSMASSSVNGANFGEAVALSAHAEIGVIGAPKDAQGVTWVFEVPTSAPTTSPSTTPTLSPVLGCSPGVHISSLECYSMIEICQKRYRITMKWNDEICSGNTGDSGCQCDQYCGYSCPTACNHDSQCFWNNLVSSCFNKKTNLPGVPIYDCARN